MARCDILVMEDDPLLRMTVAEGLRDAGFEVDEAEDGRAALALLRDVGTAPRVLLADVDLGPGPNGIAVGCEAMRLLPDLRVVYSSGRPASLQGIGWGNVSGRYQSRIIPTGWPSWCTS